MERDAFSAGVEPGGLHSHHEIKILICYMLSSVREPLPRTTVLDILSGGGMANFFDASAAIDDLLKRHNLCETDDDLLTVTETGRHAATTLADMIPFTLRERSVDAALRLLACSAVNGIIPPRFCPPRKAAGRLSARSAPPHRCCVLNCWSVTSYRLSRCGIGF